MTEEISHVGEKARQGTAWLSLSYGSTKILSFVSNIFLARLLEPSIFGLAGMAAVFTGIVQLLGNFGVGQALVQRKDGIQEHANAAFYLNIMIGAVLALIQIGIAPYAAGFYHEPMVKTILMITAIGYLIGPLGSIHATLLSKDMRFKRVVVPEVARALLQAPTTVLMAYLGFGVWSIVVPALVLAPLTVVINWRLCPWRPALRIDLKAAKNILRYGKHVFVSDWANYFVQNSDYLLIGRFLGARSLGLYTFAFNQAMFTVNNVTWVIGRITFPAFSIIQEDREKLRLYFLQSIRFIALFSFPLLFGLLLVSSEYILVIYGAKWLPAVVPFRLIVVYGLARSIASPAGQLLYAIGRPDINAKWNLGLLPTIVIAIFIGVKFGIIGVATAIAVTLATASCIYLAMVFHILGWRFHYIWQSISSALFSALMMAAAVEASRGLLLSLNKSPAFVLTISIVLGALVYCSSLRTFFKDDFNLVVSFVKQSLGNIKTGFRIRPNHIKSGWLDEQ